MALVTNGESKTRRYKIKRFNLEKYFESILIEGELGFGKPDPRVYKLALSNLHLSAENVWMVGDNLEWDVKGPKQLGIYSIWFDYKRSGLPLNSSIRPDRIITEITELLQLLESMK